MDKYRKNARKREVERNKARRRERREELAQTKPLDALDDERARLIRSKNAPAIAGKRIDEQKIDIKLAFVAKAIERRGGDAEVARARERARARASASANANERERDARDSAYWHPTLNPSGAPPIGKPWKWNASASASRQGGISLKALTNGERDESESESASESESESDMPPPAGVPPGFELVFPEEVNNKTTIGVEKAEDEDEGDDEDEAPGAPPSAPPADEEDDGDGGDGHRQRSYEDEDDDDDTPLPPPPRPPPSMVHSVTTMEHRAPPRAAMPRPNPPPRRPPQMNAGFFAAPRAVVERKPVDRAEFTTSAPPTATPLLRADQNPALRALVPASVRVKRQEAPEAKRQRTGGRAIDAAPAVDASTKSAHDDKYLNFLDEMSTLGAFE